MASRLMLSLKKAPEEPKKPWTFGRGGLRERATFRFSRAVDVNRLHQISGTQSRSVLNGVEVELGPM